MSDPDTLKQSGYYGRTFRKDEVCLALIESDNASKFTGGRRWTKVLLLGWDKQKILVRSLKDGVEHEIKHASNLDKLKGE